jgi:uncharacterized protein DUF5666
MKSTKSIFQFVLAILLLSLVSSVAFAKGSELGFRATVAEISKSTEGDSTVTVSVFSDSTGFDFAILVNGNTKIESNGNPIALSELEIGDFIRVRAFFSAAGIVAEDIDLLDGRIGQFRLRGLIDNITPADNGALLEILGISVLANANTSIRDRALGANKTVDSLVVGALVDAKGRVIDNAFIARRINVGKRREGHVEFEGAITQINGGTIIVTTRRSGASLTVIINDSTSVRGNLVVDALVEVEGFLNEQLHVVADEVKVDANGNGDAGDDDQGRDDDNDDDRNDSEVAREVALSNIAGNAGIEGKAKFKHELEDNGTQQEFEVEIEDALAETTYRILVDFGDGGVDFGSMTTSSLGRVEVEFDSSPEANEIQINNLLPSGKDVRDIQQVQVTLNGTVVMEANF